MKFSRKLFLGFAVILVLAVAQAFVSVRSMLTLREHVADLSGEYTPELILAGDIRYEIAMAGYHMRAYFTSLNPKDYQAGVSRLDNLTGLFAELRELGQRQTKLKELDNFITVLDPNIKTYIELCAVIDGVAQKNAAARVDLAQAFQLLTDGIGELNKNFIADRTREEAAYEAKIDRDTAGQLVRRNQRMLALNNIELTASLAVRRVWRALAEQNNSALREVADELKEVAMLAEALQRDTRQQKNIPLVKNIFDSAKRLEEDAHIIDRLNGEMGKLGAERLVAFNNVLNQAAEMTDSGEQSIRMAAETSVSEANLAIYMLAVGTAIMLVLGIACSAWIVRSISKEVERVTGQLDVTTRQLDEQVNLISGASDELANMATQQAASLEETSSALEQVTSMSRQNADNVQKTNEETSQVVQQIEEGSVAVKDMGKAMSEIDESAEEIGRIIKTIEEIAFQTNLLALNAAVEAARAGEAGKGFAVVADEVRNLAQRSAQAAQETTTLIQGTVERVRRGGEISRRLGDAFIGIQESAQNVGQLVGEITTAINEQSQGIDQVSSAMAQIDSATQLSAANAEKVRESARDIEEESGNLVAATGDLNRLVHGKNFQAGSPAYREMKQVEAPRGQAMKMLPPPM